MGTFPWTKTVNYTYIRRSEDVLKLHVRTDSLHPASREIVLFNTENTKIYRQIIYAYMYLVHMDEYICPIKFSILAYFTQFQ